MRASAALSRIIRYRINHHRNAWMLIGLADFACMSKNRVEAERLILLAYRHFDAVLAATVDCRRPKVALRLTGRRQASGFRRDARNR